MKLSNTNLVVSRHIKREKVSLPVDVRRSKTSLLKLPINWRGMPRVLLTGMRGNTVKSRCNEPLYNEVLGIKNYLLYLSNSKIYEKLPRYNETSLSRTQFASPLALHYMEVPLCGTVIPGSTSGERIMRSMFATLVTHLLIPT